MAVAAAAAAADTVGSAGSENFEVSGQVAMGPGQRQAGQRRAGHRSAPAWCPSFGLLSGKPPRTPLASSPEDEAAVSGLQAEIAMKAQEVERVRGELEAVGAGCFIEAGSCRGC